MTASSKQILASTVFGLGLVLATLLALAMVATSANFGFFRRGNGLGDLVSWVLIANPLIGAFVRAKYPETFDQPGYRALLGLAMLCIVFLYVSVILWFAL